MKWQLYASVGRLGLAIVALARNPSTWTVKQEDLKFQAILDYTVRSYLKTKGREPGGCLTSGGGGRRLRNLRPA